MLYRDGFFHADLHPANLLVQPGGRVGFIDLGQVGRFDEHLKRHLLLYFYCLVIGDAETAARYLTGLARAGRARTARASAATSPTSPGAGAGIRATSTPRSAT